jgi:hypothetical protein
VSSAQFSWPETVEPSQHSISPEGTSGESASSAGCSFWLLKRAMPPQMPPPMTITAMIEMSSPRRFFFGWPPEFESGPEP